MYEIFEHTADLGLRVAADTLEELFVDAARGLFSMIVANLDDVRPAQERSFDIPGTAVDYLLFDWLTELLYAFDTTGLLLSEFTVRITPDGLSAACRGEPADRARHRLEHEVKAITYHGLVVRQENGRWRAEVIVDI